MSNIEIPFFQMIKEIILATMVLLGTSLNVRGIESVTKWHEDASFWASFICFARNFRSFGIYRIYTEDSYQLREFVKRFTQYLYRDCQSLLYLKTYHVHSKDSEDGKLIIHQTRYPGILKRATTENPIKLKVPVHEVNRSIGIHFIDSISAMIVILIDNEETFDAFLNHALPKEWDNRMTFLVIIVMDNKGLEQVNNPEHVAENILKRLWRERQILNVIFVAPFTNLGNCAFTYNPIESFTRHDETGKIEMFRFESRETAVTRMTEIYTRNLNNLNGYPLKVGMFERIPTSIRLIDEIDHRSLFCEEKVRFTGIDGIMLETIANTINFTAVVYGPTDGIEFGYQMQNGTYVGTLGDIVSKKIDISFNGMFIKMYGNDPEAIRFSLYSGVDKLCLVVPKALKIPQWLQIFQTFSLTLWIYLGIVQIVCSTTWYIIQRKEKSNGINFVVIILDTILLFVGEPRTLPDKISGRILIGSLLLLSVTITGIFNGSLYKGFTTDSYYKDIDELKDLDASGLPIGTGSPNLYDLFGSDNDSGTIVNLRRKFNVISKLEMPAIDRTAYLRNFAAVDRENDLVLRLHTKYVDREGNHLLHIIPECPRTYFLAYAVQWNSVFLRRINVIISRIVEAGLPQYWYSSTFDNYLQTNQTRQLSRMQQKFVVFNLYDVQTPFFILGFGHSLSLVIFLGEYTMHRKVKIYLKIRQYSRRIFDNLSE